MLPVLGQEGPGASPDLREETVQDACCDDCATPEQSEAEVPSVREELDGLERTVVRVTGMDCASCALTVEKGVSRVPGVRRATVNFAAGRLDAEHDPGVEVGEIEAAVEGAGYGVERSGDAETPSFWRQPRVLLTLAGTLLFGAHLVNVQRPVRGWRARSTSPCPPRRRA